MPRRLFFPWLILSLLIFSEAQALRCTGFVEAGQSSVNNGHFLKLGHRLEDLRKRAKAIKDKLNSLPVNDFLLSISEVEALALEISYLAGNMTRFALSEVPWRSGEIESLVLDFRKNFFSREVIDRVSAIERDGLTPPSLRLWARKVLVSTLELSDPRSGGETTQVERAYLDQARRVGGRVLYRTEDPRLIQLFGKQEVGYQRNDFSMLMQTIESRAKRERLFREFHRVDFNDAVEAMAEILVLRSQDLQGQTIVDNIFTARERFRELSLEEVQGHLSRIRVQAEREIAAELEALTDLARRRGINEIKPWDVTFLIREYYRERDSLGEQFFPYFRVSEALRVLNVVLELMGLELRASPRRVFHDIPVYGLYDKGSSRHLGDIHLDLFPRENKDPGTGSSNFLKISGKFSFAASSRRNQRGAVLISMNLEPRYGKGLEAELTPDALGTLFHEFGHALHQLLPRKASAMSRISTHVADHLLEVPSTLMEEVLRSPEVLSLFRHKETGSALSGELLSKAQEVTSQRFPWLERDADLLYAVEFDLAVHGLRVSDYEARTPISSLLSPKSIGPLQVPILLNSHGFGHIFGYGYETMLSTYLLGERIARDYVKRVMPHGVFGSDWGPQVRREVLEAGAEFNVEGF